MSSGERLGIWERVAEAHHQLTCGQTDFTPAYHYTTFSIPKRRWGWTREIFAPSRELASLQRALLHELFYRVAPHEASTAFFPGRSIVRNAATHHLKNFMFKTDILNFFPSISGFQVASTIAKQFPDLGPDRRRLLTTVLTFEDRLPQGAPSSPHLANLYMWDFDEGMSRTAASLGALYSRYADDIVVTSDNEAAVSDMARTISSTILQLGLGLHGSKTKFFGRSDRKIVTGLDVSADVIRPTKKFRKSTAAKLRVMVNYNRWGMARQIRGRLAFWKSVCPADGELCHLEKRFKEAVAGRGIERRDPDAWCPF